MSVVNPSIINYAILCPVPQPPVPKTRRKTKRKRVGSTLGDRRPRKHRAAALLPKLKTRYYGRRDGMRSSLDTSEKIGHLDEDVEGQLGRDESGPAGRPGSAGAGRD